MPVALLCLLACVPPDGTTPSAPVAPLPAPKVLADGVRVWSNLPYRTVDGEALRLDLALPPQGEELDSAAAVNDRGGPTPLVLFVHGGGWVAGTKTRYQPEALALARRGVAAAAIEYRLSRVGTGGDYVAAFPAALNDVRAALAFLVGRAGALHVDPDRVALIGDSAGGHLSLLAGLSANGDPAGDEDLGNEPGRAVVPRTPVAAVVNLFGVTDMPAYYTGSKHARTVLSLFLAGHLDAQRPLYDAASPVRFVDADDPPVLTLHGTADPVVPFDQAERLHAALEEAGVSNRLVPVEGGTHGLFRQRDAVRTEIARFLDARFGATDEAAAANREPAPGRP